MELPPHTLYSVESGSGYKYRLFVGDLAHEPQELHDILNALRDTTPFDTLEVRVNSGGGFCKNGKALINVLNDKFAGRVDTVLESDAHSMGAMVFLAGNNRIIYPDSEIMFHDVAVGLPYTKLGISASRLATLRDAAHAGLVADLSPYLEEEVIASILDGEDYYMYSKDMCATGIATHVSVGSNTLVTAQDYLKLITSSTEE